MGVMRLIRRLGLIALTLALLWTSVAYVSDTFLVRAEPLVARPMGEFRYLIHEDQGLVVGSGGPFRGVWVARCSDASCMQIETPKVLAEDAVPGSLSASVTADGEPLIAYHAGRALRLIRCTDLSCTDASPPVRLADGTGRSTAVAESREGPLVLRSAMRTYPDTLRKPPNELEVIRCRTRECGEVDGPVVLDGQPGGIRAVVGQSGEVAAVYEGDGIRFIRCTADGCSEPVRVAEEGFSARIAWGSSGYPVIAFWKLPVAEIDVASCLDDGCMTTRVSTVASLERKLSDIALSVGRDGIPVVVYPRSVGNDLRMVRCADPLCEAAVDSTLGVPALSRVEASQGPDGRLHLLYARSTLGALTCTSADCAERTSAVVLEWPLLDEARPR